MPRTGWSSLYLDTSTCDISLKFENDEPGMAFTIPVHSFVLATKSLVFRTMLESFAFKESRSRVVEIQLTGDVTVGLHFVKYLYTDTLVDVDLDVYIILMKMAHMYSIGSLLTLCEKRLHRKVEPSSVCRVYQALEEISSRGFCNFLIEFMLRFAFVIFMEHRHVCLNERTLTSLLESDYLNACDENKVFDALWQWGRVRCIQEKRPGNIGIENAVTSLLPYIRWDQLRNENEEAPWFRMVEEYKKKGEITNLRLDFAPYFEVSLNYYAQKLKFGEGYRESVMEFRREGKYLILLFSCSKDIIITGFSFIMCVKDQLRYAVSFILNSLDECDPHLNGFRTTVCSKNHYLLRSLVHKNVYSYRVKVELPKPFYIKQACINTLHMRIIDKNGAAFPQFNCSGEDFSKHAIENGELLFSIRGKVASITTLYYYVNK